ncbi:hypothetical protein Plec18167_002844 [Paecilomyces lecythidis]|uniref:Uncharacterized protein n=1 Tax=Paecilomyces lecythidis TaxID=3004212 RepID=A0ABR3Y2C1_9EURO
MNAHIQRAIDESQEMQDRGIKKEFRNVQEIMDQRFSEQREHMDTLFNDVNSRLDDLSTLKVIFSNSKIVHVGQKLLPLPGYDVSGNQLPVPDYFPSTALRLYRLQERKNLWKLRSLITYYQLEKEVIRLNKPLSLGNDESDSEAEIEHTTEADLRNAIESNPLGTVFILGSHLGVDCDTLHDRITQLEFQEKKGMSSKRAAEESSEMRVVKKLLAEGKAPSYREQLPDEDNLGPPSMILGWEVDSEKFHEQTRHLRLRNIEKWRSSEESGGPPRKSEQKDLQLRSKTSGSLSPTEKMSSSDKDSGNNSGRK